jgi:hypothetical protein
LRGQVLEPLSIASGPLGRVLRGLLCRGGSVATGAVLVGCCAVFPALLGGWKQIEPHHVVAEEWGVVRLRTNDRRNPPEDAGKRTAAPPLEIH